MLWKVLVSLGLVFLVVLCAIPAGLEFSLPALAKNAFLLARLVTAAVGLFFLWRGRGPVAGLSAMIIILLTIIELAANTAMS